MRATIYFITILMVNLLYKKDKFYCSYLPEGGDITITSLKEGLPVVFYNPLTGEEKESGNVITTTQRFEAPDQQAWVLLIGENLN